MRPTRAAGRRKAAGLVLVSAALLAAGGGDTADAAPDDRALGGGRCHGRGAPLPPVLVVDLRSGAFPETDGAVVAVHVPPRFDASRRPGAIVYFHGWMGCVTAAMAADDTPCSATGEARRGAALADQVDAAEVNALLIAVELRVDRSSGEPGQLAMPSGLHGLLQELFREHLSEPLGCTLDVDGLDRVVVIAHSGGYQAAAAALRFGDVPEISEVDLLDALYGADETFAAWTTRALAHYDPLRAGPRRFVDLYTCCGGTRERSRSLARTMTVRAAALGWRGAVFDDDEDRPLDHDALSNAFVFKRVIDAHGELPRTYVRALVEHAGFARTR